MNSADNDEYFRPTILTFSGAISSAPGIIGMHMSIRAALELSSIRFNRHPNATVNRSAFMLTANQPPESPPMPATDAPPTNAQARQRRATSLSSIFERLEAKCVAQGMQTHQPPTMLRWRILLANEPTSTQVHAYLQPPTAIGAVLEILWTSGFRIDGFSWGNTVLGTILNNSEQMLQVREMVQWIQGYCSCAPMIGLPPAPWRLTAARSLVERINAFDNPTLSSN